MVDRRIPIPSMIGGVSQQASEFRLPTQVGFGTKNIIGTVTDGITKRAGLRHEGVLNGAGSFDASANTKFHVINRDDSEKYLVAAANKEIRVWDMLDATRRSADITDTQVKDNTSPTPANITYGAGGDCDYLATSDPENDLHFLSLADHTLVLNRAITPALKATLVSTPNPSAVIEIPQAPYGQVYTFTITWNDGTARNRSFSYRSFVSDGTPPSGGSASWINANMSISAQEIVNMVKHMMGSNDFSDSALAGKTNLTGTGVAYGRLFGVTSGTGSDLMTSSDWDIASFDRYILISNKNADDFEVHITNPDAGQAAKSFKDVVQVFTDLPPVAADGTVIEVKGDEESPSSAWYKFTSTTPGSGAGYGEWSETQKPGVKYIIDETTMPHLLIRQADGNFQFTPADGHSYTISATTYTVPSWGTRVVGDENNNPDPPFIGSPIRSMFFWKNRMGFLVDDQVVLSEAGEYFNFWRTTIPQLLDSARIFTGSGEHRGAKLEHAVPFADHLVIFGESRQFVLRGAEAVTPVGVSVAEAAGLDVLPNVEPVSLGSTVMAGIPHSDEWGGLAEIHDVGTAERPRLKGIELTKVCPKMIPKEILHITGSTSEGMVAVVPKLIVGDWPYNASRMWLFNWFDNGDERVQAAWWPIEVQGPTIIRHAEFIQDKLWILGDVSWDLAYGVQNRLNLYTMDLGSLNTAALSLDEWIDGADVTTDVLGGDGESRTVTLPFALDDITAVNTFRIVEADGLVRPIRTFRVGSDPKVITVEGADPVKIAGTSLGHQFDSWVDLSMPVVRDRNGNTQPARVSTIQNLEVLLKDSTILEVVVIPKADWPNQMVNPTRTNEQRSQWDTQQIGQWVPLTKVPTLDDQFRTFIGEAVDNVYVLLECNEPYNFRCLNGSWDVRFHQRYE